jgi:molybdopterin converting factor small subunit
MIEVHLYGVLKDKAGKDNGVIHLRQEESQDIFSLLSHLNIDEDDVGLIFVNGEYSSTGRTLKDGDRVGIFPTNMSLLYKWYFRKRD